jgi:hypothetical protein
MLRRILPATATALLLFFLCLPAPAQASNLGFKLDKVAEKPQPDSLAIYFVSFPFHRSFTDFGSQADPRTPDGQVTAVDVLIDWYTGGDGCCPGEACDNGVNFPDECGGSTGSSLIFGKMDPDPVVNPAQSMQNISILPSPIGGFPIISGTDFSIGDPSAPGRPDEVIRGYQLEVSGGTWPFVIVGSHDPSITEWVIPWYAPATGSLNINQFSMPYHTTFTTAEELLVAMWNAAAEDEQILISDFDPSPVTNPEQLRINKSISPSPIGGYVFSPRPGVNNFPLIPGNGYEITVINGGTDDVVVMPLSHY